MPTTDEELAELQRSVEEKRQRLIDARTERENNERSLANDITAAQLQAEADKLDALIAEEEKRNSPEVVEAAISAVINPEETRQVNEALHEAQLDPNIANTTTEIDPETGEPVATEPEGGAS